MLSDALRSSFVPLIHVFATIVAKSKPSSPRDLWNDYRDMFIRSFETVSEVIASYLVAI